MKRASISAVVPAYNEAQHIAAVLDVLCAYPHFTEVIVFDDGSTDTTAEVVSRYPVTYLRGRLNHGKGYAMDKAVAQARGDIVFFSDADIIGITPAVIDRIVAPLQEGRVEMSVAMRGRGIPGLMKLLVRLFPTTVLLSGERAVTRSLWQQLPPVYKQGFRIESALNYYALRSGRGLTYTLCPELHQVIKEQKYGLGTGLARRLVMIYDIVIAHWKLRFGTHRYFS